MNILVEASVLNHIICLSGCLGVSLKERNTLEKSDNPVPRTFICSVVNWHLALNLSLVFAYPKSFLHGHTRSLGWAHSPCPQSCFTKTSLHGLKSSMLKDQAYVKNPTWKFHLDLVLEVRSWKDHQIWSDISR